MAKAKIFTIPAPSKGLNKRDGITELKPNQALILSNLVPNSKGIEIRPGYILWCTVGTDPVRTLAQYAAGSSSQLIAATDGELWDATSAGVASSIGSGFTSDYWQTVNFGGFLVLVNGVDQPQKYNGTLSDAVYTGISDDSILIHVNSYRSRLWLLEKETLSWWYGGTDAVQGALTELDLSTIFQKGGKGLWSATWTRDGGQGSDDFIVFGSDQGEILIYQGSDPGDDSWTLVGRFAIPTPIGYRSVFKYGSDLVVLTLDGAIPLMSVLPIPGDNIQNVELTDMIHDGITQAANFYSANPGWELFRNDYQSLFLVNIPLTQSTSFQYAKNSQTKSWWQQDDINAFTWCNLEDVAFFGAFDGNVYRYGESQNDAGSDIVFEVKTAFSAPNEVLRKRFIMFRPIFQTNGTLTFNSALPVDYQNSNPSEPVSTIIAGSPWDLSPWDTSSWGGTPTIVADWRSAYGWGYVVAIHIKGAARDVDLIFNDIQIMYEEGGPF